jgi:GR25 family glycosyltransferase involved in LPS biosynthesis
MRKVVINLPERADRRAEMQAQLGKVGWEADFFAAIRPTDTAGFPSIGARGCFLSHLAILKKAMNDSVDYLVVMEDDLNFSKDFRKRWEQAFAELRRQGTWSIFYPAHTVEAPQTTQESSSLREVHYEQRILCTHFMVFNGLILERVVRELETMLSRPPGHPNGGPMHVDGAYSVIRATNPDLRTLIHIPSLGYQRPSRTDIGQQRWLDSVDMLRPLLSLARKVKLKLQSRNN